MSEKKTPTVVFAPGCFDHFDGTQEELDALVKDIQEKFSSMSPEDFETFGRLMTEDDIEELPEEVKEQIARAIFEEEELDKSTKRKLQ